MGLLDALFGAHSGHGLLDMLQKQQYQPSAEFQQPRYNPAQSGSGDFVTALSGAEPQRFNPAQSAYDMPSAQPPMPAQRPEDAPSGYMNIGGYQMPQFGPRDLYQPQQAQLPPNAQPAQGQMPPQQQMQPQQPEQLPPALGGGQQQNGFLRGLQSIGNGGGLISALTGNYNDPVSQQRQNLKAQYDALVPMLGQQKAMLAVMNPEAGKILVAQALEKKQYGFTKLDDGTIVRQDPMSGKVEPAYQASPKADFGVIGETDGTKDYGFIDKNSRKVEPLAPAAPTRTTIPGPDGKPIQIPEGLDAAGRKAFIGEVARAGAKVAAGERTEVQAKSEKFGNKMELAERNLKDVEGELSGAWGRALDGVPGVGGTMATNWAQSEKYQKAKQARDNFITALLRDESGAAIGTSEFQRYERELFPQPGDGPSVVTQKREARKIAIEAMKKSAGPGYKSPTFDAPAGGANDPLGIR